MTIPHPIKSAGKFYTLEDLRRVVSDFEAMAREYGWTADMVTFSDEFLLTIRSEKLTDNSVVLNATLAIAPKRP